MGTEGSSPTVEVQVLGPLRLLVDGLAIEVRGPKRRAVLALLALAEGRTVPVDHLVDALWPSESPESGRQALHTHMSRLRGHFGAAASRIQTHYDGYRLDLGEDELDVTRARVLLALARRTQPSPAYEKLRTASGLWRGSVLADLTDVAAIATAVEGFERLHREVIDAMLSAAVEAGRASDVIPVASNSVAADPIRETAVLLLMRVLAATAQAPAALQVGRDFRHRLVDETGLDPSPALSELERDIASGSNGPVPAAAKASSAAAPERPERRALRRTSTGLIGRETEEAALHRLLAEQRVVTIIGPGGVGKTRLAAEIAAAGTSTMLLLAPVTEAAAVPHALASALNLTDVQGDVLASCLAVLEDRRDLLVIDNCEHLLDAVRDIVEAVLTACPGVIVLATSRERLGLTVEYTYRLAPLALPAPVGDTAATDSNRLQQIPSVAVFLDRAARVRPQHTMSADELAVIVAIVRRLDGMPLAIELAAGRLSSLSVSDLHSRLDRSLDLLGSGRSSGDARHRTLRATIEWSYELLTAEQQSLFRNMAVFVDGIDLASAEGLAATLGLTGDPGGILAHLVDASMIDADLTSGTRYRMLETLRAFALDRLGAAGERDTADRHLVEWAIALTGWIGATMTTELEPEADAAVRRELANLRAAWQQARGNDSPDDAVAMITGLFEAVAYRDLVEIRTWAEDLADDPQLITHPGASTALGIAAEAAYHRGAYQRSETLARSGLEYASDTSGSWICHSALSVLCLARGEWAAVVEHSLEAVVLATRPRENLGIAALAMAYSGDPEAARQLNGRGLVGAASPTLLAWGAYVDGEIESIAGRTDLAEKHYVRAVALARRSGATFVVGVGTVGLLSVQVAAGRISEALTGYDDVIDYFARTGNWTHLWATLRNLASLLRRLGDDEPAALLDAAADQAPDAPADDRARDTIRAPTAEEAQVPQRAAVIEIARRAINRHRASS